MCRVYLGAASTLGPFLTLCALVNSLKLKCFVSVLTNSHNHILLVRYTVHTRNINVILHHSNLHKDDAKPQVNVNFVTH